MKRKIILFIAQSIDGYIADINGNVDWLEENIHGNAPDDSYDKMYENIDTVIMGRKTYNQVITELSPDKYVYSDKTTYVITSHKQEDSKDILFKNQSPELLIKELKKIEGNDIWIVGGQQIIDPLVRGNLIDEYILTTVPIFLGDGIRLFEHIERKVPVKLKEVYARNELVYSIYQKGGEIENSGNE